MSIGRKFQPVPGEVIPISAKKSIGLVAFVLALAPVGIGLTWLWVSNTKIPLINQQVTWWGALIGAVLVAGAVVVPPVVLWQWLVRKQRLILGTEYLQVVVTKGGKDIVKQQVALKNIESAAVQKHLEVTVIAIQLRDVDAPDLVPLGGDTLTKFKKNFGLHLYIEDSYQLSAEALCRKIEKAASI